MKDKGCGTHRGEFDDPLAEKLDHLLSARRALILESLGLRKSPLRAGLRGIWAFHYRMPPESRHAEIILRMDQEIDALREKLNPDPQSSFTFQE